VLEFVMKRNEVGLVGGERKNAAFVKMTIDPLCRCDFGDFVDRRDHFSLQINHSLTPMTSRYALAIARDLAGAPSPVATGRAEAGNFGFDDDDP
jgi:hypothetical protein